MRSLRYTSDAIDDLGTITEYIAQESGNRAIAESFTGALLQKCSGLAQLPGTLGRARPELMPDIRSIPFKSYVIFFRYADEAVEIVNILEGHRDIAALFKK